MNKFLILLILLIGAKVEAQTSALGIADSLYAVGNYSQVIDVLKDVAPSPAVLVSLAEAQKANEFTSLGLTIKVKESPRTWGFSQGMNLTFS